MKVMEIEASVTMSQNFWVRVPDNMPDEAILKAIDTVLAVESRIIDPSACDEFDTITHEVTADGDVELLDDDFEFRWERG